MCRSDSISVIVVFSGFEERDAWAATRVEEMKLYQRNPWVGITVKTEELEAIRNLPGVECFPDLSAGHPCEM